MESDQDLAGALLLGGAAAVVRIRTAAAEKAGTRSATASYQVDVERQVDLPLPSPVVLKHFGPPRLEPARLYAVVASDTGRFHGAWQLHFAAAVEGDDAEQALGRLRERIERVRRAQGGDTG